MLSVRIFLFTNEYSWIMENNCVRWARISKATVSFVAVCTFGRCVQSTNCRYINVRPVESQLQNCSLPFKSELSDYVPRKFRLVFNTF